MEESYSCPDCAFTANRDLVLQVLRHFFNCTSFRCIQDISCGHSLGPSTPSPQTQQKNNNSAENNSCYGDVAAKETKVMPVHSEFTTAKVYSENTHRLCSPHSNTESNTINSRATNDFIFQSDNMSNVRENTSNKEASPMDLLEHNSEEIFDEQFNTDSIENMQSETGRNSQDKQTVSWKVESYHSLKPHHSILSVTPPSLSENNTLGKTKYGSTVVSAQDLRMAKLHDPVSTDTARSDMQIQAQIKVEPNSDEYGTYSTVFQGTSSTEGTQIQSSILRAIPAVPPAVDNSCRDSIQQLGRDTVNTDAPTPAAGESVSDNSQELLNGQQVQWPPATTPLIRCPVCSIAYKGRRALTKHCKHQHPHHPCCTICCTIFNSREELLQHQKSLHREETFQCRECNKTFGYKRNLLVHLKEQHLEVGKLFPCKECQKMYRTRRALKEHQRIHTNSRQYICDECGKCLKSMSGLKGHYVHVHHRYY